MLYNFNVFLSSSNSGGINANGQFRVQVTHVMVFLVESSSSP